VGRQDEAASARAEALRALGVSVRGLSNEESRQLRQDEAVMVTGVEPGSLSAMAGIRPGILILEVNRRRVGTPTEFTAALAESDGNVQLLLADNGHRRLVQLRWR